MPGIDLTDRFPVTLLLCRNSRCERVVIMRSGELLWGNVVRIEFVNLDILVKLKEGRPCG